MYATHGRFQCPACKGDLLADTGRCRVCGQDYATQDGILDFVAGRFATQLDAASYDASHTIDDDIAEADYRQFRQAAAHRWPPSLGAVVEIGCGTGGFSRAMIGHGDATDAVLTDVSLDMLRLCRGHLDRLGIGTALPVQFATYSATEACFRDAAFDTCIGASVVHHIADVRGFLADVWRLLKPGGRACFIEPRPALSSRAGDGVRRHHRDAAGARSDEHRRPAGIAQLDRRGAPGRHAARRPRAACRLRGQAHVRRRDLRGRRARGGFRHRRGTPIQPGSGWIGRRRRVAGAASAWASRSPDR